MLYVYGNFSGADEKKRSVFFGHLTSQNLNLRTGSQNPTGYNVTYFFGRSVSIHKVSVSHRGNELIEGMFYIMTL